MPEVKQKDKKKDPRDYKSVSLTGKVMEKAILGDIEKHLKDNAVTGHSEHGFMKRKSCLSNLSSFYDKGPSGQMSSPHLDKYIM
ncbi:rna-directed dna polymerase from mobile element jockey-like [Willisornis vidua]|uniref:Rna-directed dna polymerase from mobile element jockey-like n=1 Tax=Willisornis vidua TaxID=1566151 RepID=A0ABQ9D624_9PASS|nr:rna-directed dna polymerase from mobile element jockey-like [Willisornis vidua]